MQAATFLNKSSITDVKFYEILILAYRKIFSAFIPFFMKPFSIVVISPLRIWGFNFDILRLQFVFQKIKSSHYNHGRILFCSFQLSLHLYTSTSVRPHQFEPLKKCSGKVEEDRRDKGKTLNVDDNECNLETLPKC